MGTVLRTTQDSSRETNKTGTYYAISLENPFCTEQSVQGERSSQILL